MERKPIWGLVFLEELDGLGVVKEVRLAVDDKGLAVSGRHHVVARSRQLMNTVEAWKAARSKMDDKVWRIDVDQVDAIESDLLPKKKKGRKTNTAAVHQNFKIPKHAGPQARLARTAGLFSPDWLVAGFPRKFVLSISRVPERNSTHASLGVVA